MNAIAAPDRAQRHTCRIGMCHRLAELGMELAEAAHREALRDTKPPAPPPVIRSPGLPDLPGSAYLTQSRDTTFADLFERISRATRQALLLEARLDSEDPPRPISHTAWHASRYEPPAAATNAGPRGHSDATRLDHERLEDDLATDAHRAPEAILAGIAAELDQALHLTPPPAASQTPARLPHRPSAPPTAPDPPGKRPPPTPSTPPRPGSPPRSHLPPKPG